MAAKTFKAKVFRDDPMCYIEVPFDPKAVFGKVRAPVKVTVNGYSYRSTLAAMGGPVCIPLRRSHREAAGLEGGEVVSVRLELDDGAACRHAAGRSHPRAEAVPGATERWRALSYTPPARACRSD